MRKIAFILLSGLLAASCAEIDIDETLLERTDISVTLKGKELYSFNPNKAQICFNESQGEYIMFDEDFLSWFILNWNEKPASEGQKILIDVDWGTRTNFKKEKGLGFEVRKVSDNGMVWLWNASQKIGLTINLSLTDSPK